ncbi:Hypothetical_protein [Hexamita inflata]|uniref:Hypothetical_protein n=1 Tax=Hexamita inflata TaxID=28002 RepID=A0AA86US08_9EUKA|nr:Hypothetical protein HINF_LOCUS50041 [Hexamita inflata]
MNKQVYYLYLAKIIEQWPLSNPGGSLMACCTYLHFEQDFTFFNRIKKLDMARSAIKLIHNHKAGVPAVQFFRLPNSSYLILVLQTHIKHITTKDFNLISFQLKIIQSGINELYIQLQIINVHFILSNTNDFNSFLICFLNYIFYHE